ncbi:hypothetical protein [Microbacterium sp. NPDC057944]|uniref:DUF7933 domain-containing protein n=1 Tax=Microbacterium sp. NPDC057944 TaxID=3346286 RepID=UPI0036DBE9CE
MNPLRGPVGSAGIRRSRTTRASAAVVVVAMLATFFGVVDVMSGTQTASAAPGSPGVPGAPAVLFQEDFQQGAGVTELENYVSASGATYSADPFWLDATACNGFILSQTDAFPGGSVCGGRPAEWTEVQRKAAALGLLNSPQNSTTNRAVSSNTSSNGPANARQFISSQLSVPSNGRFVTFSVDAAATNCGAGNQPSLRFYLTNAAGTETPVSSSAINPCTDSRRLTTTAFGGSVSYGRFPANGSMLYTSATLGITMRNVQGNGIGNDGAFDNIRVLDVTPQLDKSFSPASVPTGGASTLTLTVTNTSELAEKVGWSFTDSLPAGLVVRSPANVGGTCTATVAAAAGTSSVVVSNGRLNAGQASCTITLDVTSNTAGTYSNCAANITAHLGIDLPACAAVTFVVAPFSCTSDVVYGLNASGEVLGINRLTGASTQQAYFPAGASIVLNGLGLSADGRYAYAVAQTGTKNVYRYDTTTGLAAVLGSIPQASATNLFMGAVNPVDGMYYVGGNSGSQYVFYAFDPVTGTSLGERFRIPSPITGFVYSDLTFDSLGRASVVSSSGTGTATANQLLVIETVPTNGTVATTRLLANLSPATAAFQGAAFGSDGYLYTQHTTATNRVLTRIDPNSGAVVSSANILNPNGTANTLVNDLASCSLGNTLTLQKNIDGRYAPGDQFTVTITGNGTALGNTGTTSGASTGLQTAPASSAGPVVGVPARTYTITETPSGGAVAANYRTRWECVDTRNGGALVASGTGTTGTVTMPAGSAAGSHVTCVFTNVALPSWTLAKQALRGAEVLATGATVQPGDVITYRVTATNTSGAILDGARLSDDLSAVLDDASFVAGSAQLVIAGGPPVAVSDPAGTQLVTGLFGLPGGTTAVLTYRVTVAADAWSATLTNVVSGTAGKPGQPVPPQPCGVACTTSQVTPTPVQVQKVGEASTGVVVPMDGSSWAIFSAATGGTALVDPVPAAVSGGSPVTGLFRDVTLTAGTYWLEETRALDGFALLAGRVPFAVAADGTITLGAGVSSNVQLVDVDGIRTIRVEDVPALDLPDAGGPGDSWIYLIGLALLLAGTTAGFVRSKRQRRAAIPSTEGIPDLQNRRNER